MKNGVIIIGSGHAGGIAAITLRQNKYMGPILIVGKEEYYPYQRPALSKGYLLDKINENSLYLKTSSWYKKQNIHLILNNPVKKIQREKKIVILDDGKEYKYDQIIIATGSSLKKIQLSCNKSNIHYLRTLDDALKIKNTLNDVQNIVIIGAGYIGLEIASSAIKKNKHVTVIEMGTRVMGRSISEETSLFLQKKHEIKGVNFLFNASVADITDYKKQKRISYTGGKTMNTDCVILGLGVKPNIEVAVNAGLECENGIIVDENGLTSDQYIYAAGDCTNHPNDLLNKRIRLESVHNAVEQAKSVASSIAGNQKPYHQVPWFWSEQYDLKIQIAGISEMYDDIVITGNKKSESFSVFHFKKKKLISVEAINNQKGFLVGKRLIKQGTENAKNIIQNIDQPK
jgi:3-phenylpropionate/trans-cinnamate dioxygenase ferredoxin reductase subunit